MRIERLREPSEIRALINVLNSCTYMVLDTETTGLDPYKDKLLTIILSGRSPDTAFVFDAEHRELLRDLKTTLVGHNLKFDLHFLYTHGVDLRHLQWRDTMLLHHLYDENAGHSLDSIVKEWFQDDYKERFWASCGGDFTRASVEEQDQYAGKDVIYTRRVYDRLLSGLQKDGVADDLSNHVHSLARALLDTEVQGVRLDLPYLVRLGVEHLHSIRMLKRQMREIVKVQIDILETNSYLRELNKRKTEKGKDAVPFPEFNFDSSQQLQELLYDRLKLPKQLNQQRKLTCDDAALEALEAKCRSGFIRALREYRGKQKVYGSFIEGSLSRMRDGLIRPSFNINGTVTGRISSSEPNMQQLPRAGGIRGIYVPEPGRVFVSCDYSQLEVTLAAHFSLDPQLLKVVNEGASLHDITAAGLNIDRQAAKTINFALQYGAGVHKIQSILGCNRQRAEEALARYWETYEGLKRVIDSCHAKVAAREPIVNPFGRRRRFPLPAMASERDVARAQRQSFNALVQGTGADLTNRAFYLVSERLKESGQGRGLFVVHDEILIEVDREYADYWDQELQKTMVQVGEEINLRVPLKSQSSGPMDRWED